MRDGVTQVRLTGGEPLLRRSLVDLVAGIAALEPRPQIAMTTNGVGLERVADRRSRRPASTGSTSASTPSTPRPSPQLTRRDRLADVEAGLKAAADAGLTPVKVNAVAMRGINDESVADVLAWCLERGYELRFIEQMPLDAQHAWDRSPDGLRRGDPRAAVASAGSSRRCRRPSGGVRRPSGSSSTAGPRPSASSPASVAPFCAACDRTRLTADGQVRNCLFSEHRDRPARPAARGRHRRGAARL